MKGLVEVQGICDYSKPPPNALGAPLADPWRKKSLPDSSQRL